MPPFMCDIQTGGVTYYGAVSFSSCFAERTAHVLTYLQLRHVVLQLGQCLL